MLKSVIVAALSCVLFASVAVASGHAKFDKHFGDIDNNSDGFVDKAEWSKAFPADQDEFAKADVNKDGKLNHDEWHDFKKSKGIGHAHS